MNISTGGGTELSLTRQELPTEQAAEEHRGGWSAALDQLTEILARARRP